MRKGAEKREANVETMHAAGGQGNMTSSMFMAVLCLSSHEHVLSPHHKMGVCLLRLPKVLHQ